MALLAMVGGVVFACAGCRGPIPPRVDSNESFTDELGVFYEMPRARVGSLPFPGPFTLYDDADPEQLGRHSYSGDTPDGAEKECDRGIVYTRRAGFLDICHVRNAADMTAYVHARVRLAIDRGWERVRFRAHEPSEYTLTLTYPEDWDRLTLRERRELGGELAILVAERVAFEVMTWHEILTWYGYRSTVIFSERGSAFTHEDTASHALGVRLAGEALRAGGDFDEHVTAGLDGALRELAVVGEEELARAQELVEHEWWSRVGGPKRRMLDIGLGDGAIEPWTIAALRAGQPEAVLRLAWLGDVRGRDLRGVYTLEIDPRVLEGFKIRARLDGNPSRVVPERHFPALLADIADEADEEPPWPDPRRLASER